MLDNNCSNNSNIRQLAIEILRDGNINSLLQYRDEINATPFEESPLSNLDTLLLCFIDLVWMPDDIRKDFLDLHTYALMQLKSIFNMDRLKTLKTFDEFYDMLVRQPDSLPCKEDETLCHLIIHGLYIYTNGVYGFEHDIPRLDNALTEMILNDYSRISDDTVKLLCLAYYVRNCEGMFHNNFEKDLFETYMYRKKYSLLSALERSLQLNPGSQACNQDLEAARNRMEENGELYLID